MSIQLTQAKRERIAEKQGIEIDAIPCGALHTDGKPFDEVLSQMNIARALGRLPEDSKLVSVIDREVVDLDENDKIVGVDFTYCVETKGMFGIGGQSGVTVFTANQLEALKQSIALFEAQSQA